jgi:hypothetical protein
MNNFNNNLINNINNNPFMNNNPFNFMPMMPPNYNGNNLNNMNPFNNINSQPINFNLPNNNNINHPNQNMIFPMMPLNNNNNNINSSTNIIKSTFLNEDDDFGEPMNFDQINNLPIINYPKKEIYDEKCPLCEFAFCFNDRVTKLEKCQHTFHKECLGNFLVHKKASKCPICKVSLI